MASKSKLESRHSLSIVTPSAHHAQELVDAVRRSRALHRGLVQPPQTVEAFRAYAKRFTKATHIGHLLTTPDGELAGVVNISEIVRGAFQSAYLGYYAFVPFAGQGYMTSGIRLVLARGGEGAVGASLETSRSALSTTFAGRRARFNGSPSSLITQRGPSAFTYFRAALTSCRSAPSSLPLGSIPQDVASALPDLP